MSDKNSTLTWLWMEEVWNNGSKEAIEEMLHEHAIVHGIEGITERGPKGFKDFYHSFRDQFPEVHVDVQSVVCEGNFESSLCHVTATNDKGKQVNFGGMTMVRIENGKIMESWNNFDFQGMYQQLGFKMVPAEAETA